MTPGDDLDPPLNFQRRHIGQRLREIRERAGLTMTQVGEKMGVDRSTISRWEASLRKIGEIELTKFLTACKATNEEVDELVRLVAVRAVSDADNPVWTSAFPADRTRQKVALLRAEENAMAITCVAGLVVPGLLQTSRYIRATMRQSGMSEDEVLTKSLERTGRSEIITRRSSPVHYDAYVDEVVIRRRIGGDEVMREQLEHLHELNNFPNVNVQIVPLDSDWNGTHTGQFVIIDTADQNSVVQQELSLLGVVFNDQDDVESYREILGRVKDVAMSPADSQRLIAQVIEERRTTA